MIAASALNRSELAGVREETAKPTVGLTGVAKNPDEAFGIFATADGIRAPVMAVPEADAWMVTLRDPVSSPTAAPTARRETSASLST